MYGFEEISITANDRLLAAVNANQLNLTMRWHGHNRIASVYRARFLGCIVTTSIEEAAKFLADSDTWNLTLIGGDRADENNIYTMYCAVSAPQ